MCKNYRELGGPGACSQLLRLGMLCKMCAGFSKTIENRRFSHVLHPCGVSARLTKNAPSRIELRCFLSWKTVKNR